MAAKKGFGGEKIGESQGKARCVSRENNHRYLHQSNGNKPNEQTGSQQEKDEISLLVWILRPHRYHNAVLICLSNDTRMHDQHLPYCANIRSQLGVDASMPDIQRLEIAR